jgi:hypothetical protein
MKSQIKKLTYVQRTWGKDAIIKFLTESGCVKNSFEIVEYINANYKDIGLEDHISAASVRKIINEIRALGESPICSTSKGYFISYSPDDIFNSIRSIEGRISSMSNAVSGMRKMMPS